MKNILKTVLLVIIVFNAPDTCAGNPFSRIMSFFQGDMVLEVIYRDHKNLIQGSHVYLADTLNSQKILIGKVTKISLGDPGNSRIEITIDKTHKNKLYETTQFVLMSNLFSQDPNPYIVAISPSNTAGRKLLKSGASVKGVTFLEYQIAAAKEELKKLMDSVETQNKQLLKQLEEYIDTFNSEEFQKKIEELADQITQFSKEQKEAFKKDVLPGIKNMLDSIMEQLEKQGHKEKSKDLEKQFHELEKSIDV